MLKFLINPETTKKLITVFSLIVTLLIAASGALEADASIRASNANRESQTLAHQVSQQLQRMGFEEMYEFNTMIMVLTETIHSLAINGMTSILEGSADQQTITFLKQEAAVADARDTKLKLLSKLYNDPQYAPATPDGLPKINQFLNDLNKNLAENGKAQNDASDRYARFDGKSSTYTSIISILSVNLFLLGLAQVISNRLRIILGLLCLFITSISVLWIGITTLV